MNQRICIWFILFLFHYHLNRNRGESLVSLLFFVSSNRKFVYDAVTGGGIIFLLKKIIRAFF